MTKIIHGFRYEKDNDNIVTLTMDMDGPVNAMNNQYRAAMDECVTKLEAEKALAGVIVTSAKKTFFAGGDLKALVQVSKGEEESQFSDVENKIKAPLRRLEKLGVPVVAAINGAALGGGLEIGLVANHRVVWNSPSIPIGLPEVTLGLLPGAGGVVRTIHMLGLQTALPLLLDGKSLNPEEACEIGWVDQLVDNLDDLLPSAKKWIAENPEAGVKPWDIKGYKMKGGDIWNPAITNLLFFAPAANFKKTRGLLPAQESILAIAGDTMAVDFDAACRIESRAFAKIVTSKEAKNIITTNFFQMASVKRGAGRPKGSEPSKITKIGVLGESALELEVIACALKAGIEVMQKREAPAVDNGSQAEYFKDCELVINSWNQLGKGKIAIDSSIENLINLHALELVDGFPLLEIICLPSTNKLTIAKAFDLAKQIRKTAIVVKSESGSYTTRVLESYLDEGRRLLQEGVEPVLLASMAKQIGMSSSLVALAGKNTVKNECSAQDLPHDDIKGRLLVRQVVESLNCLNEGVISSVADGNVASLLSLDAPTWTGGFIQVVNTWEYEDETGVEAFAQNAKQLQTQYGDRFVVPGIVGEKIRNNEVFE